MPIDRGGKCWNCGADLTPLDYDRQDTCRRCGRDTRACKGCEHHSPGAHNDCHENQADRVVDKERANFCDYFRPAARDSTASSRDALRAAAEALFKKK